MAKLRVCRYTRRTCHAKLLRPCRRQRRRSEHLRRTVRIIVSSPIAARPDFAKRLRGGGEVLAQPLCAWLTDVEIIADHMDCGDSAAANYLAARPCSGSASWSPFCPHLRTAADHHEELIRTTSIGQIGGEGRVEFGPVEHEVSLSRGQDRQDGCAGHRIGDKGQDGLAGGRRERGPRQLGRGQLR